MQQIKALTCTDGFKKLPFPKTNCILCRLLFLCAVAGVLQTTGALGENTFIKIVAINLSLA